MKIVRVQVAFKNHMTRTQVILGWIYAGMHILVLPWLLNLYAEFSPNPVTNAQYNLLWYGIGIVFVLCVMLRWLRSNYDTLLDNFRICVLSVMLGLIIQYAMSMPVALILMLTESAVTENPNNANIMEMAVGNFGVIKALAFFVAPIVEEVLFRGVIFGSIRPRSRRWAYIVSVGLFAVYHVLSYVLESGDAMQLIYILQYIPAAVALAWVFEHSGCIWTSIFYHMGFNMLSFTVLNILEQL